jgi:cyclic 2,3-diphosphoglycerate synthetase
VARTLARRPDVVVVAMGRGGPPEPEVIDAAPTVASLLELSRAGRHAASDHLEIAALAGVTTIGCRRAGGGLAGAVGTSNVAAGARVAAERRPDFVVFDGSGAAIPPVAVDRRVLVIGRGHDPVGYLNAYRVLVSDLVVLVGGGDAAAVTDVKDVPVVEAELVLRPMEPLLGRRVAVFTTGAAPTEHLDADVVAVSRNLANRELLREDLQRADADVFLVELKAAAIDVVAEAAAALGIEVVLAANDVVSPGLDEELEAFASVGTAS